jgi:hypothetical protein
MFARYLLIGILFSALLNMPAPAKDRLHYHGGLRAACSKEINTKCEGVPDAYGQLLACVYQQEATLSPRCEAAVWGSLHRLGEVLAKDPNVLRYCDAEALQWCKETISGSGRLLSCFLRAQQVFSPLCKASIYSVWDRRRLGS